MLQLKSVVISITSTFQRDVARLVAADVLGPSLNVREVVPAAISAPSEVLELIASRPDVVILPLTWGNYMSLFIAEIVHLRRLPTKLILWSRTKAPPEIILRLFDAFVSPPAEPGVLKRALLKDVDRCLSPDEIRRGIAAALRAAHCFWRTTEGSSDSQPPNYGEYLNVVKDYSVSDKLERSPKEKDNMTITDVRILAVFSNPVGSDQLRLGAEERVIRECIRLSKYRDRLVLRTSPAATVKDLQRALLDEDAEVVQFSGHGTNQGLLFEDEHGKPYSPPAKAVSDLLLDFSPPLQCALFNACYSVDQGKLLSTQFSYTIVTEHAISDDVAIEFCRGFYDALGAGKDIPFAFKQGCRAVTLAGHPSGECPILLSKDDYGP